MAKKVIKNPITENILTEELPKNTNQECPYISGWENISQVADDVWNSIHSDLLSGDLLFAYRSMNPSSGKSGELCQIVIVRNFTVESGKKIYTDYSVGEITTNYSALIPHIPLEYLKGEVVSDLENNRIDKKILEAYKQILINLENETFSN